MKTKVFKSGNSLAVRLPKELEMPCGTVSIHREGRKIIIEEVTENGWPNGFFESIRICKGEMEESRIPRAVPDDVVAGHLPPRGSDREKKVLGTGGEAARRVGRIALSICVFSKSDFKI